MTVVEVGGGFAECRVDTMRERHDGDRHAHELVELPLSGGDWLLVRRSLSTGAHRAMYRRMVRDDGSTRLVDAMGLALARVLAYLVEWSLVDEHGTRVSLRELDETERLAALEALDVASFREIADAITDHEERLLARRERPGWREAVVSDLAIARLFGWRYEWVAELDIEVYSVLVEELADEQRRHRRVEDY